MSGMNGGGNRRRQRLKFVVKKRKVQLAWRAGISGKAENEKGAKESGWTDEEDATVTLA